MKLKVLIAEHNQDINKLIEPMLEGEGFSILFATDGNEAVRLYHEEKPDVILMDRMIPPMGGIRLCRWIQMEPEAKEPQIIMLSTREGVSERMLALDAGADDFLVRPFEMEELLTRIRALKTKQPAEVFSPKVLVAGQIEMNLDYWTVAVAGNPISLTEKEFRLLQELIEAKGKVLSREALLQSVWGHERALDLYTRTVDIHISRLRGKLGSAGDYITTVRNVGYRIDTGVIKH